MARRLLAHIYDLIILIVIAVPIYIEADSLIYNNNLPKFYYLFVILLILFVFFLVFGLLPKKLEGNIGTIMEKLRVTSTKGKLTSMRFFIKNFCAFLLYVPFMVFVTQTFVTYYEITEAFSNGGIKAVFEVINTTLLIISLVLILIKIMINSYLGNKFKQSFTDRLFDMKTVYKMHKEITINDLKDAKDLIK